MVLDQWHTSPSAAGLPQENAPRDSGRPRHGGTTAATRSSLDTTAAWFNSSGRDGRE